MTNRNQRGSSYDRRARKEWIFSTYGVDGIVTCRFCAVPMLPEDCTVDCLTPRSRGGAYRRDNVGPACRPCQDEQGVRLRHPQLVR
jgi:5-methylcytosine-specific restriction endonuclease McrA